MTLFSYVLRHSTKRMAILISLLAASPLALQAQVAFSPPTNVSNGPAPQYGQQMIVDSAGNVDIVWTGPVFSRSTDGGSTFSAPVQVSNGSGEWGHSMALDKADNIYIAWAGSGPLGGSYGIFISRSSDAGATFSAPVSLSNAYASRPQVAVDPSGKIDIVWVVWTGTTQTSPGSLDSPPQYAYDFTAYFSQSSDGGNTFSPATAVFTSQEQNSSQQGPSVQLAVDASSNIDVLGEGGGGQFVLLARSNNGGATFSITYVQNQPTSYQDSAKMALDAAGNIDVVWEHWINRYHVFFSRSTDGGATFSPPVDVTPLSPGAESPKMAVDSSGNINVAWLDYSPGYFGVFFAGSTDGGATFSTPKALSTDPALGYGLGPYSIAIAVDSHGNISVVWEDNDSADRYQNQYGSQQWDIYFTSSRDGGATFQGPVTVSNTSGISASPVIAVDASSAAYITWMFSQPSPYNFNVYFSRSVALSSLSLNPSTVVGGLLGSSTGTVTLSGPAPSGGAVVSLSSSNASVASVPASVTVPAGATSASFTVNTSIVVVSTSVTISGSYNGTTQSASLTVLL